MGPTRKSRSPLTFLPMLVLLCSGTVLLGAGDVLRISSPAHNAKVSGTIDVRTELDASVAPAFVMLVVDETRPASTNSFPPKFELDTRELTDGPHRVSAEAYADFQRIAASQAITIHVSNQSARETVAKQPRTTTTTAGAPETSRTAEQAALASTTKVAELVGAKRGPAHEPSPTELPVQEVAPKSETTEVAAGLPSSRTPAVMLNDSPVVADVAPTLVEGRMHTGLRALFTAAGARIDWLPEQRMARCETDSLIVEVPIGSRFATVNGRQVDMGAPATITNGRTMIPLRFFAQVTGSRVSWDARTRVASLQTPSRALASAPVSMTSAASVHMSVTDRASTRTPIYEVAGLGP